MAQLELLRQPTDSSWGRCKILKRQLDVQYTHKLLFCLLSWPAYPKKWELASHSWFEISSILTTAATEIVYFIKKKKIKTKKEKKEVYLQRVFQYCIFITCAVSHLLQAHSRFPLIFVPFMIQWFGRDWRMRWVLVLGYIQKSTGNPGHGKD